MKQLKLYYLKFKIYITNSIWVLLGLIVRSLITIFIISKIASLLGVTEFGWYNFGISVFTIFYAMSSLGFSDTFIIKYLSDHSYSAEEVIGTTLVSRIIFSIIILASMALWIIISKSDVHYWAVTIACLSIIFQSSEVITAYFQYKLKAKIYVPITLVALTIEAILLLIGINKDFGLIYFISIYTLERLIILIGLLICLHYDIDFSKIKFNKTLFHFLIIQSWPLLLGAILTALYARFDQVLIKYFLNPEDLGIYGTSVILYQIWFIIPCLIIPIIFPKIADLHKQKDSTKFNDLIFLVYGSLNYLAIGLIIFIFLFGNIIIETLYGSAYTDSVEILKILTLNLIILFQSHLTTNIMIIENEEKYLFKIKFISVVLNIGLNIAFLSLAGVQFAAYSLLFSSIFSWIIMSYFNTKMYNLFKINIKSFMLPFKIRKMI